MAAGADANANLHVGVTASAGSALAELGAVQAALTKLAATSGVALSGKGGMAQGMLAATQATKAWRGELVSAHTDIDRFNTRLDRNKMSVGESFRHAASQMRGFRQMYAKEAALIDRVARDRFTRTQAVYQQMGEQALKATPVRGIDWKSQAAIQGVAMQKQQLFNKLIQQGTTGMLNFGKNTQWAGRQLMVGFSIPLAVFGGLAAMSYMKIEKAGVQFRRVYGDLNTTLEETSKAYNDVITVATDFTKYGIAVEESVAVAAQVAATGKTGNAMMTATSEALRLATLGQIEYNQSVEATIALQSAFGVSTKDLPHAIDLINAAENQTILTVNDFTKAVPRVGPVVKQLGGSYQDLIVMMTALREGGVSAEQGANAIKSGLGAIIKPSKDSIAVLKEHGIRIKELVAKYKGDLMPTLMALAAKFQDMKPEDRAKSAVALFGKYQYARWLALLNNLARTNGQAERARRVVGMTEQEAAANSVKELARIEESPAFKFEHAMARLRQAIAPIGAIVVAALTPVVNFFTMLADKFNELPSGIKTAITIILGLIGVVAPVFLMLVGLFANLTANAMKFVNFIRRAIAVIRGQGEAFKYLDVAELDANVSANQLTGSMERLTTAAAVQRAAVMELAAAWQGFNMQQLRGPSQFMQGTGALDPKQIRSRFALAHVTPPSKDVSLSMLAANNPQNAMLQRMAQLEKDAGIKLFKANLLSNAVLALPKEMNAMMNVTNGPGMAISSWKNQFKELSFAKWGPALSLAGIEMTDSIKTTLGKFDERIVEHVESTLPIGPNGKRIGTVTDAMLYSAYDKTIQEMRSAGGEAGMLAQKLAVLGTEMKTVRISSSAKLADLQQTEAATKGNWKFIERGKDIVAYHEQHAPLKPDGSGGVPLRSQGTPISFTGSYKGKLTDAMLLDLARMQRIYMEQDAAALKEQAEIDKRRAMTSAELAAEEQAVLQQRVATLKSQQAALVAERTPQTKNIPGVLPKNIMDQITDQQRATLDQIIKTDHGILAISRESGKLVQATIGTGGVLNAFAQPRDANYEARRQEHVAALNAQQEAVNKNTAAIQGATDAAVRNASKEAALGAELAQTEAAVAKYTAVKQAQAELAQANAAKEAAFIKQQLAITNKENVFNDPNSTAEQRTKANVARAVADREYFNAQAAVTAAEKKLALTTEELTIFRSKELGAVVAAAEAEVLASKQLIEGYKQSIARLTAANAPKEDVAAMEAAYAAEVDRLNAATARLTTARLAQAAVYEPAPRERKPWNAPGITPLVGPDEPVPAGYPARPAPVPLPFRVRAGQAIAAKMPGMMGMMGISMAIEMISSGLTSSGNELVRRIGELGQQFSMLLMVMSFITKNAIASMATFMLGIGGVFVAAAAVVGAAGFIFARGVSEAKEAIHAAGEAGLDAAAQFSLAGAKMAAVASSLGKATATSRLLESRADRLSQRWQAQGFSVTDKNIKFGNKFAKNNQSYVETIMRTLAVGGLEEGGKKLGESVAQMIVSGLVTYKQGKGILAAVADQLNQPGIVIPAQVRLDEFVGADAGAFKKNPIESIVKLVVSSGIQAGLYNPDATLATGNPLGAATAGADSFDTTNLGMFFNNDAELTAEKVGIAMGRIADYSSTIRENLSAAQLYYAKQIADTTKVADRAKLIEERHRAIQWLLEQQGVGVSAVSDAFQRGWQGDMGEEGAWKGVWDGLGRQMIDTLGAEDSQWLRDLTDSIRTKAQQAREAAIAAARPQPRLRGEKARPPISPAQLAARTAASEARATAGVNFRQAVGAGQFSPEMLQTLQMAPQQELEKFITLVFGARFNQIGGMPGATYLTNLWTAADQPMRMNLEVLADAKPGIARWLAFNAQGRDSITQRVMLTFATGNLDGVGAQIRAKLEQIGKISNFAEKLGLNEKYTLAVDVAVQKEGLAKTKQMAKEFKNLQTFLEKHPNMGAAQTKTLERAISGGTSFETAKKRLQEVNDFIKKNDLQGTKTAKNLKIGVEMGGKGWKQAQEFMKSGDLTKNWTVNVKLNDDAGIMTGGGQGSGRHFSDAAESYAYEQTVVVNYAEPSEYPPGVMGDGTGIVKVSVPYVPIGLAALPGLNGKTAYNITATVNYIATGEVPHNLGGSVSKTIRYPGDNAGGMIGLSGGNWVPGNTGGPNKDSVPALLTPGEFVVTRNVAQKYRTFLEMLNAGRIRLAAGGQAGRPGGQTNGSTGCNGTCTVTGPCTCTEGGNSTAGSSGGGSGGSDTGADKAETTPLQDWIKEMKENVELADLVGQLIERKVPWAIISQILAKGADGIKIAKDLLKKEGEAFAKAIKDLNTQLVESGFKNLAEYIVNKAIEIQQAAGKMKLQASGLNRTTADELDAESIAALLSLRNGTKEDKQEYRRRIALLNKQQKQIDAYQRAAEAREGAADFVKDTAKDARLERARSWLGRMRYAGVGLSQDAVKNMTTEQYAQLAQLQNDVKNHMPGSVAALRQFVNALNTASDTLMKDTQEFIDTTNEDALVESKRNSLVGATYGGVAISHAAAMNMTTEQYQQLAALQRKAAKGDAEAAEQLTEFVAALNTANQAITAGGLQQALGKQGFSVQAWQNLTAQGIDPADLQALAEATGKSIEDLWSGVQNGTVTIEQLAASAQQASANLDMIKYAQMSTLELQMAHADTYSQEASLWQQRADAEALLAFPQASALEARQRAISREIAALQKQIAAIEKSRIRPLEKLNKELQKQADALSRQNTEDQKIIDKINEGFQKQFEALDKIEQKEQAIMNIRREQLNVADALSRGDIAAAAQASLSMEGAYGAYGREQFRWGLEEQQKGLVEPIEARIKARQEQIDALQESIRLNSEKIEEIQDTEIQAIEDQIEAKQEESDAIGTQLELYEEMKHKYQDIIDLLNRENAEGLLATFDAQIAALEKTRAEIERTLAARANEQLAIEALTSAANTAAGSLIAAAVAAQNAQGPAETGQLYYDPLLQQWVNGYPTGQSYLGYSKGGFVLGNGTRDAIPAMLTPGEFVVTRAGAKAYGPLLPLLNSAQPRFKLNDSQPTGVSAKAVSMTALSMYNTTSNAVTVNVLQPGASAHEIADVVLTKLTRQQDRQLRRSSF